MGDLRLLPEEVPRLAAGRDQDDFLSLAGLLLDEPLRRLEDVRVEGAAETAVGGHADHPDPLRLADGKKGMILRVDPQCQAVQHIHEFGRVRTEIFHPLLRRLEFRGGHHIHGLGDLLGLFYGADLPFDILECGHENLLLSFLCHPVDVALPRLTLMR